MAYYLYENRQQRKVRIHRADCGNCQDGQGKTGLGPVSATGCWHGPFKTYRNALRRSQTLGQPDVRACRVCARW